MDQAAKSTPGDTTTPRRLLTWPVGVQLAVIEDRALLALQGPAAEAVLGRLAPEAAKLPFLGVGAIDVDGIPCLVSRSGYTGEDGFEISLPADRAEAFADDLLGKRHALGKIGGDQHRSVQCPAQRFQPSRGVDRIAEEADLVMVDADFGGNDAAAMKGGS